MEIIQNHVFSKYLPAVFHKDIFGDVVIFVDGASVFVEIGSDW